MGPQFQADLNILHLNRHCDKSKWLSGGSVGKWQRSKLLLAVCRWSSPSLASPEGSGPASHGPHHPRSLPAVPTASFPERVWCLPGPCACCSCVP